MTQDILTNNGGNPEDFFDDAGGDSRVNSTGVSLAARPSLSPPAAQNAADPATEKALARAVQSMRLSELWNKHGASLICLDDFVPKINLVNSFGVVAGTLLGHSFCLAQIGAAVYGGFSVTNPLYYIIPPGFAFAAKWGVDRIKPAKGDVQKQQRRNFLKYAVGSSVLAIAWGMRGHLGIDPGGSYGKEFAKLNSAQQSFLEGQIGMHYFPELSESERQKTLKEAARAGKTPVAYVFDRDGLAVMEICKTSRERDTNVPSIVRSRLEHSLPVN